MANNVLIVEDEFLVALDLEDIVTKAGFDVVGIASDLASLGALEVAPDIALVDLNLRDGPTGVYIASQLAEQTGATIIYVTANPKQIGMPAPTAIGYVRKPFSRTAIQSALEMAESNILHHKAPAELVQFA